MDSNIHLSRRYARHIDCLAELLTQKGYFAFDTGILKNYLQSLACDNPLEDIRQKLTEHLDRCLLSSNDLAQFNVSAYALWSSCTRHSLPFARCNFRIAFTNQGFQVRRLKLVFGIGHWPDAINCARDIPIHRHEDIPAAASIRQMLHLKPA